MKAKKEKGSGGSKNTKDIFGGYKWSNEEYEKYFMYEQQLKMHELQLRSKLSERPKDTVKFSRPAPPWENNK